METSPNAAGNTGFDEVAVSLEKRVIPGSVVGGGTAIPVTIQFPAENVDSVDYSYGDPATVATLTQQFSEFDWSATTNVRKSAVLGNYLYCVTEPNVEAPYPDRVAKFTRNGETIDHWDSDVLILGICAAGNSIYSTTPGIVYKLDPDTMEVVESLSNPLIPIMWPQPMAADSAGNLYVPSATEIIKYTAAVGTWAVWKDGLTSINDIAATSDGTAYVIDGTTIRKFASDGTEITWTPSGKTITAPNAIAVDNTGRVYISQTGQGVHRFSADGVFEITLGSGTTYTGDATCLSIGDDFTIYGNESNWSNIFRLSTPYVYYGEFAGVDTQVTIKEIEGAPAPAYPAASASLDPQVVDHIKAEVRYTQDDGTVMKFEESFEETDVESMRFIAQITVTCGGMDQEQTLWLMSVDSIDSRVFFAPPAALQISGLTDDIDCVAVCDSEVIPIQYEPDDYSYISGKVLFLQPNNILFHGDTVTNVSPTSSVPSLSVKCVQGATICSCPMLSLHFSYLNTSGEPLQEDAVIPSINAITLQRAVHAEGVVGEIIPTAEPLLDNYQYRVLFDISTPLRPDNIDALTICLIDTFNNTREIFQAEETGIDSGIFEAKAPQGTMTELDILVTLDTIQDGTTPDSFHFSLEGDALGFLVTGKVHHYSEEDEWNYRMPDAHIFYIYENKAQPSVLHVQDLVVDGVNLGPYELEPDADNPAVYRTRDNSIVISIINSTDYGLVAADTIELAVDCQILDGKVAFITTVESGIDTSEFRNAEMQGLSGSDGDGLESVSSLVSLHGYKIQLNSPTCRKNAFPVTLFGKVEGGGFKILGTVTLTKVADDIYESKTILNIANLDRLDADVKEALSDYALIHGSGSAMTSLAIGVGGAVVTLEIGSKVDDLFNWGYRKGMWICGDGPNTGQFYVYVHDSGGTLVPPAGLGKSSWLKNLEHVEEYEYSLDINRWAEYSEMLECLNDMDGDDILIYWGHSYTAKQFVVPTGGTVEIAQSCDGLAGYRSNFYLGSEFKWGFDAIPATAMSQYMTHNEKDHAPGIVVLGGCATMLNPLKETFMDKGTILYVGFSQKTSALRAGTSILRFCDAFFQQGKTVNDALDYANNIPLLINANSLLLPVERTWLWAQTSNGGTYNYDASDGRGKKGVNLNFSDFLKKMRNKK